MNRYATLFSLLAATLFFQGCAHQESRGGAAEITIIHAASAPAAVSPLPPETPPVKKRALPPPDPRSVLMRKIPKNAADRNGWANDILTALFMLKLPPTPENLCSAIAIIEQESSFREDPPVPGLPKIVWGEIEKRREKYGIPQLVLDAALAKESPNGKSYRSRIDGLRTEKDMNALFEDMIAEVPGGKNWLAGWNPIRTGGPMQVSVEFAENHVKEKPYPYRYSGTLRDEVFSRRGGVYFGIADLLDYPFPYSESVYRFADYNSGRFSSRNAAFQAAVAKISGQPLDLDGDLLSYRSGEPESGQTENALLRIKSRIGLSAEEIRRDLLLEKSADFIKTPLYQRVFALAPNSARAMLPRIVLASPKIKRHLTTQWFAQRVNERYRRCLGKP